MSRRPLLSLAALLIAALPLAAQQHPNQQKGFDPNKLYSFESLDNINTFNGNLVVTLPIGQRFRGDGNLSYGFNLVYNGRPWDAIGHTIGPNDYLEAVPDRRSNAGMGWLFSLGRLIGPADATNQVDPPDDPIYQAFLYETPDGNDLKFAYEATPLDQPVFVDQDTPNFIRMRRAALDAVERYVDLPDGTIQKFKNYGSKKEPDWRLIEFKDAFENKVEIRYDTKKENGVDKLVWTINESSDNAIIRTHTVTFALHGMPEVSQKQTILEKVDLAAFNGKRAVYSFDYGTAAVDLKRASWDTLAAGKKGHKKSVQVYLLKSIQLSQDGVPVMKYEMTSQGDDGRGENSPDPYPGWLSKLRLPTGGFIQWIYTDRHFPDGSGSRLTEEFKSISPVLDKHRETNTGVALRQLLDASGNVLGTWTYTHQSGGYETCEVPPPDKAPPPQDWHRNFVHQVIATVTDPQGLTTSSYYHTFVQSDIGRCTHHDPAWETPYGLPFTLLAKDSSGKFLSTEVRTGVSDFLGGGTLEQPRLDAGSLDHVLRSNWITYDKVTRPGAIIRVETARRTYFERDTCDDEMCYTESFNSNYDQRGHFRQVSTGSNFGDFDLATGNVFTPGESNFSTEFTDFTVPAANAAIWQLDSYTEKCSADETSLRTTQVASCAALQSLNPVTQQFCFSTGGFLERVRTLKNGATAGDGDVLAVFTSKNGNVTREDYYGGDLKKDSTDPYDRGDQSAPPVGCTAAPTTSPRYSIAHTYSAGARKSSQYAGVPFLSLDLDIDAGTGLPKVSRDTAGLATSFHYEPSGRLESVTAPGVAKVQYRYQEFDAVKAKPAAVEVEQDAGGDYGKTLVRFEYDDLGRVVKEENRLADDTTATRRTLYDVLGRRTWVSELTAIPIKDGDKQKTSFEYDVFGRTTKITASDGSTSSAAYTGNGVRHVTRSVSIATSSTGTETNATTHEVYDAEGRLWKVKEPSGPTSAQDPVGDYVTTTYDYDAANRLIAVAMEGAAQGEGTQPRVFNYDNRGFLLSEQHPEKGAAVTYSRYDPRGHAWRKTEGPEFGDFDLQFEFDSAERLLLVAKKKAANSVEKIKEMQFSPFADKSKGKLLTATRHNYLDVIGDVKVVETFGYEEPGGRMASRTTAVSNAGKALQTFTQVFSYTPFGQVETVSYPKCAAASPCSGIAGVDSVKSKFHNGFMTAVEGFADVTYWPNGLVHTVTHKSKALQQVGTDTQEINADTGMARPKSITFSGFCRGPEIAAAEPSDQTQVFGSTPAVLSITPPAGATKYEWYEVAANGTVTLLPDQKNQPSYNLPLLSATKRFLVRVSDATCSTDSRVATVDVPCADVAVQAMPSDQPIKSGNAATFSISAYSPTGKTLKFQWYEGYSPNTEKKVGNGTNTFTTGPLTARAQYWVRVTVAGNDACAVDSPTVEALICRTPVILKQPQDQVVDLDATPAPARPRATVLVQGEPPFTYRVFKGTQLLVTETTNASEYTYIRTDLAEGTETYSISIRACNDLETKTRDFVLGAKKCRQPKFFLYAPQGMIPVNGADNVIEIVAYPEPFEDRDSGKFTYQWFRDGVLIENAHGSSLLATAGNDGSTYTVRMTSVDCNTYIDSPPSHLYVYGTCPMRDVSVTPTRVVLGSQEKGLLQAIVNWGGIKYEWYRGMPGNTRYPQASVPGRADQLTVDPKPDVYWVRAINECGESRDSQAVYVELSNCGPIIIRGVTPDQETTSGQQVELAMDVTGRPAPNHYAWLYDPSNPTAIVPSNSARISVAPKETTTYWGFAESTCASAESPYVKVLVRSCGASHFTVEPPAVVETDNFTPAKLKVASNDPGVTFEWFEGEAGDTRSPTGGHSAEFTTPILSANTSYWARATTASGCKFDTRTVRIDVCIRPVVKSTGLNNSNSVRGAAVWIGFNYEGTKLTYQWYRGEAGDDRNPILETRALALVRADETTPFWVRATNRCGSDDSETHWVSICPVIDELPNAVVPIVMKNMTTKLSVRASGAYLKYQWYAGPVSANVKLGTTADIISPPITADTQFWVVVNSGFCERVLGPVQVSLCREPQITAVLAETQVAANYQRPISAAVVPSETTETRYIYYQGQSGDETGSTVLSGPTINGAYLISPSQTTSYWIRALRGTVCSADTPTITVNVCIPTIRTDAPPSRLASSGELVELSIVADGGPLSWQWYEGPPGDPQNSQKVQDPSALTATLRIVATASKTYWARVTGTCGTPRDSAGTIVTICEPPRLPGALARPVIERNGTGANLQAPAMGTNLSFTWYRGATGDETQQISTDPTVFVNPQTTTPYWVKIQGTCGTLSAETLVSVYPVITAQPREQRVTRGAPATFVVEADASPIGYQWFQVGAGEVGNGTKQLVTPPVVTDTQFYVKLTSGDAVRESDRANAHVCVAPRIFADKVQTDSGAMATLFAETRDPIGAGQSTFQWYQGESGNTSVPIGATGAVHSKAVSPDVTTRYWVREVWDTCHADSDSLEIVACKPRLTQQATATGPDANGQFTFSVAAVGTPVLTYQWYTGAPGTTTTLAGTGSSITITPAAASYWARVTSGAGASCSIDSNAVAISTCEPPSIAQQPQPRSYRRGGAPALLEVHAAGTDPHYQWYQGAPGGGVAIGEDAASIQVTPQYTTQYWVRVSNSCGSQPSAGVLVSVYPVITQQPSSPPVTQGQPATLTVVADANPISYQWFRGNPPNTSAPVGTNSASYQTPPLSGAETYWVRITSGEAFTDSDPANIGLCRKPDAYLDVHTSISGDPAVIFVRDPNQNGDEHYLWYQGTTPGDTVHSTFLQDSGYLPYVSVSPLQTTSYWVREQRTSCYGDSAAVTVPVKIPKITRHPAGPTGIITAGTPVPLSAEATGTAPLTWQWYIGNNPPEGTLLPGETSASITVTPNATTSYWVRVSHFDGQQQWSADSNPALVQICTPPSITRQPSNPPGVHSGTLSGLSVEAAGTSPAYQWYLGQRGDTSHPLSGETNASLVITVLETNSYWVRVSNACGLVDSNAALMSVFPQIRQQPQDANVNSGSTATLTILADGRDLQYQWYRVVNSAPPVKVGTNSPSFITGPVTTPTQYFCVVTSGIAEIESRTATVGLCTGPQLESGPTATTLESGCKALAVMVVFEDRGSVTYRWYRGPAGDTSNLISSSQFVEVCPPAQQTPYWCRIRFGEDGCHTDTGVIHLNP